MTILDTSVAAYIAAWQRQDRKTCEDIARAIRATAEFVRRDCWVNPNADQRDVDEEADACGVTTSELLGSKT